MAKRAQPAAEEASQESKKLVQELLDSFPAPVYAVDADGRFLLTNRRLDTLLGVAAGQAISKTREDFLPAEIADEHRKNDLAVIRSGRSSTSEEENIEPDGRHVYSSIKFPLHDARGRIYAIGGISTDITERKRIEHQLRKRTKELQALYSLAEIAEREDISLDELCQELADILPKGWQYPEMACAKIRIGAREFCTSNFAESPWKQSASVWVHGVVTGTMEVNYLDEKPDEDEGPFLKEERRLLDALAERLGRITERMQSEGELRLSKARLEEAQRTARMGSWETNLVTAQVVWSDELCRLFEIAPEVIREGRDQVQAALVERIHPDDRARYEEAIAQSTQQNARYDIEYRIRLSDGSQRYLHSQGGPTLDPAGNLVRLSGTVTDITERKQLEEQLARMARHDPLTGVLNRYALEELLEREASRSERYAHPIGFLMIDVNRFKEINDRFGHAMGDKVLQAIAAVIQHNIRDADILVRYGGDEFLVILPETNGETDVVRDRILAEVAARNRTNPLLDFPVTLAIGSAHWSSSSGQTMEQVLAETDKLMYEDKRKSQLSAM
jgi:diguanylate cyclase (GGDEF)-like protein/PAS domain S-box-containing protein